jgi:hypothetical protein
METLNQNSRRLFISTFYKNNKQIGKEKIAEIFIKDKVQNQLFIEYLDASVIM